MKTKNWLILFAIFLELCIYYTSSCIHPAFAIEDRAGYMIDKKMGFLEDIPRENTLPRIRVAFRYDKERSEWISYDKKISGHDALSAEQMDFRELSKWHVFYKSKEIGQIFSKEHKRWAGYFEFGRQEICDTSRIPRIGVRTFQYSGWPSEPVRRPLVLLTQRGCSVKQPLINKPLSCELRFLVTSHFNQQVKDWALREGHKFHDEIKMHNTYIDIRETYKIGNSIWLAALSLSRDSRFFSLADDFDSIISKHWLCAVE